MVHMKQLFGTDKYYRQDEGCGHEIYSGTLLNRHPSTADTHDVMDNSESPDCPSFTSILKQHLNSGHPATPYNRHFLRSQLYANNTQRPRFSAHSSTFSARLSTITAVVNNLTLHSKD